MPSDFAIRTRNLGKCYQIYDKPVDRLKQSFWRRRKQFYREFWALKDVYFEIKKGESVGIIGSNGAGKSTLLQLICGTLNPTEGEVMIDGRISALLELGAGFNPEFTGRENIYMNGAIMGLTRAEIDTRYDEIVDFAGIGSFIEQPVKTYSSGMCVRLAFATAVNVSPDILLVDEALAVGDVRFQQKCMAKIKKFCQSGTVVFVTHNMTAVTELCSRVIWIESGRVQMDERPKDVIEKYIQYVYEGEIEDKSVTSESLLPQNDVLEMKGFSIVKDEIGQFGNFRVTVKGVRITTSQGYHNTLYAGQSCRIDIILQAHADINNIIIGYIVKDRIGRDLFGDNNALMGHPTISLSKGENYYASFMIETWPNINEDDYILTIAVAEGTLDEHEQCHYLNDALVFRSVPVRKAIGTFFIADTRFDISKIG